MAKQTASPRPVDTPLVGRERELAVLCAALASAREGRGSLVLIGGEAGVGKTTLAEVVLREARGRGYAIVEGHCFDLAQTPPYGPFVDLFARYAPVPDDPAPPEAFAVRGTVGTVPSQLTLFIQVRDFLAALAARRPVALLLDDLHWGDQASLDLLRFLARAIAERPLLLLATYRSDELTRRHPFAQLLPQLARNQGTIRLDLGGLAVEAVRTLVDTRYALPDADATRLAAYVQGRAEGNALFIGELLHALEENGALTQTAQGWRLGEQGGGEVPPLLRQVIEKRVARLDEESRRLLAVAAVIGHDVPLAVWGIVGDADEETLLDLAERAGEAHLLGDAPNADGVRFAHALIREALYESLPALRRRRVHRRVGETLIVGVDPDPDAVALHFQQANDERAYAWLMRAGERAHLSFAWTTAGARYEAALALLEASAGDPADRGWLHYRIARVVRGTDPGQSLAHLDVALQIATTVGDRALAAAARSTRGVCLSYLGDATFLDELTAGCDALEALPPEEQARLDLVPDEQGLPTITNPRGFLVVLLAGAGYLETAVAMGEAARGGRPPHTPLAELGWSDYGDRDAGLAIAYALAGEPAMARAASARALACFRETGRYSGNHLVIELIALRLPYFADRPEDPAGLADVATNAYRLRPGYEAYERLPQLPILLLSGRWFEARAVAEAAWQGIQGQLVFGRIALVALVGLERASGNLEAARTLSRELLPAIPQPPSARLMWFVELPLMREVIAIALDSGDLATARDWLAAYDRWFDWSGGVLGRSEGSALWARYYREVGDATRAHEHAGRALAHATAPRQPLALIAARRLVGELATEAGRREEAAAHLGESLALAETCAAAYERALTLLALAELRAVAGGPGEAIGHLDEARAILGPLGALPALARADALSSRLDSSATRPRETLPFGLTAREAEVLRLVAAGLGNLEIADRLSLSRRTVEQHLRNTYDKLGVDNRAAATRLAVERGITGGAA